PDNPTSALLLVEVSDTTLAYDRSTKASLYARAGIADYWTVNLVDRQVEVRRNPVPDPSQPYGFRYADEIILSPAHFVSPLAARQAQIPGADLLPWAWTHFKRLSSGRGDERPACWLGCAPPRAARG